MLQDQPLEGSGNFETEGSGSSDDCSGQSAEFGTCNEGICPFWSDWSNWSDCSTDGNGDIQSRTRDCLNGAEGDCSGPSTEEQQCSDMCIGSYNTAFGTGAKYISMEGIEFLTADSKNIVRESGPNCVARCFERAGCSAFFITGDYMLNNTVCSFIIGDTNGIKKNSEVVDAGKISPLCPMDAFTNTYTLTSKFLCIFFAPSEFQSIADAIVEQNTGNSNTPLRTWNFTTYNSTYTHNFTTYHTSPIKSSSQYVSVGMINTSGNDARYRAVEFTIETHVRVWLESRGRKTKKQRKIMPRTDEILAEIKAIEGNATSFILDGDLELPENTEVAATGPIETVEFVQIAADGSIAADCSSGTCECSDDFIDKGNGCEEIVEEQATTLAPTTTKVPVFSPIESINSLLGKLESVFEENRPGKPRTHLMTKWKKLESKSIQRHNQMKSNGCQFADSFEFDGIDSDTASVCLVSLILSRQIIDYDS